jgi:predicted DNA-binding transcriptional regulator YafY
MPSSAVVSVVRYSEASPDRIEDLALTTASFVRPAGFRLRAGDQLHERAITVRVLFCDEAARWVRESPSFFITSQEETPDGLLVTLRVRRESDVLSWLLGWGRQARVLEPESLQQRLRDEAEATARLYQEAAALLT